MTKLSRHLEWGKAQLELRPAPDMHSKKPETTDDNDMPAETTNNNHSESVGETQKHRKKGKTSTKVKTEEKHAKNIEE